MKEIISKIKGFFAPQTGYEPKIIINVGVNAPSKEDARNQACEIAEIIEIKLGDYLKQFPSWIEVKI